MIIVIVFKVGYGFSDVGISILSYTEERVAFIDYSHQVGEDGMRWVSKPPQKLPPSSNLIQVFDRQSWLMILLSMLFVTIALVFVSSLSLKIGVGTHDTITIILVPFQMMNAEPFPKWFNKTNHSKRNSKIVSPGCTGNYLLLLWSFAGFFITLAFMSNIRAMLMKPIFEKPIDSTESLIQKGKVPINSNDGGFWQEYLVNSINKWERVAGKTGIAFSSGAEQNMLIQNSVKKEGTHVSLENTEAIAYLTLTDPFYKNMTPPVFHISRETIRPYYHGWVFRKGSIWKEKIDQHILLVQQVLLSSSKSQFHFIS